MRKAVKTYQGQKNMEAENNFSEAS